MRPIDYAMNEPIRDYLTDRQIMKWKLTGHVPDSDVENLLKWFLLYRDTLRRLADLDPNLDDVSMVSAHHVAMECWTALKWIDAKDRHTQYD